MTVSPVTTKSSGRVADRFWAKVSGTDAATCWIWTASGNGSGYGKFHADGKRVYAHRWAYESLIAPIPPDLTLDHLCRNPSCVNPWHLDPVPHIVNVRRGEATRRPTHCIRGHEFTPENTYTTRTAGRACRSCMNAAAREKRADRRACMDAAASAYGVTPKDLALATGRPLWFIHSRIRMGAIPVRKFGHGFRIPHDFIKELA